MIHSTGPDPSAAGSAAEFVAGLRQLKAWADLTYRALETRARIRTWRRLSMQTAGTPAPAAGTEREWWAALDEDLRSPASRQLGQGDVDRLAASTLLLRSIDDRYGGYAVADQAVINHRRASRLLSTATGFAVARRRFLAALAENAGNAAFSCFDAGQMRAARRLYARALTMAENAEAIDVKVFVLMNSAFAVIRFDATPSDLRYAVQAAERAYRLAAGLGSARVRAACAGRAAYAYANLGDRKGFQRATSRAMKALEHGAGDDPPWITWFTEVTLQSTSKGWAALGEPCKAVRAAQQVVHITNADYDAQHVRNAAGHWLELALARVAAGEPDQACHDAMTGLRLSEPNLPSAINARVLGQFTAAISRYQTAATKDFLAGPS